VLLNGRKILFLGYMGGKEKDLKGRKGIFVLLSIGTNND
jgi:hypothetical protein